MEESLKLATMGVVCAQLIVSIRKRRRQRLKLCSLLAQYLQNQKRKPYKIKSAWVFPMNNQFWELSVPLMENERFKAKYRVDRSTFDFLVNTLTQRLERQTTRLRTPIPVDKRIAITLHCLKSGADYDTISTAYGVGKSTVGPILKDTCQAICDILGPQNICLPTLETDLLDVVNGFRIRWGFPGCVGATDGTHVPILSPVFCPEDYFNYKGWKSIIALALVDHNYKFRYISVGSAGKNCDSSVFTNSSLSSHETDEKLFPPDYDFHMIGDSAFALKESLMKPYPEHRGVTPVQFNFNYRLSRARMVVECAFGRLKARWRILMKRCDLKTQDVPMIVMTCCILHNVCEDRKDEINGSWLTEYGESFDDFPQPEAPFVRDYNNAGSEKRDMLARELFRDGYSRTSLSNNDETIFNIINRI